MIVNVMRKWGYTLVIPEGHLGTATAPQLRERLTSQLARKRPLIIDLSQVSYFGAAGFGAVMGTFARARAAGIRVHVICPNRHTRRLFQLTGLASDLPIARTLDEAVAAVTSRPPAKDRPPNRRGPARNDGTEPGRARRALLAWLRQQAPPSMRASNSTAAIRTMEASPSSAARRRLPLP